MPIKNLTDVPAAFIRLGRIKKGDKGGTNGAPRDLDYFRVVFQPSKFSDVLQRYFESVYGPKPTEINVRFAATSPIEIWDANYECYKKGGMVARAGVGDNGPYWIYYRDPETSEVWVRDGQAVTSEGRAFMEKPIDIHAPIYHSADGKPNYLQTYGRLQCVVPELTHIEVDGKPQAIVGYLEFAPKSPRDIRNISGELAMYHAFAKAAGRTINGVPFKLIRRLEDVTAKIDGKMVMKKSWVCHLDCAGEWGRKALEMVETLAIPDVVDAEAEDVYDTDEDVKSEPINTPYPLATVPQPEMKAPPKPKAEAVVNPDPIDDAAWEKWEKLCKRAASLGVASTIVRRETTTLSDLREGFKELQKLIIREKGRQTQ